VFWPTGSSASIAVQCSQFFDEFPAVNQRPDERSTEESVTAGSPALPRQQDGWRDTLRRPTFWVVLVMLAGFVYLQWPTRLKPLDQPDYVTTNIAGALTVEWEATPSLQQGEAGEAWFLRRRGMDFLVQSGDLTRPLPELAASMVMTDTKQVGGDEYEPLQASASLARYALYDAENRIQRHRIYAVDSEWIKVSVLYKDQNDEREARAQRFLNRLTLSQ